MACDPDDDKALADIEEYGCHILHVREDDAGPRFSYSIGIEKTSKQPELIVTGLKPKLTHWIINEYNRRIKDGEVFEPDKLYSGFLDGFDVFFRPVLKEHYEDYLGWGLWLYDGDEFRVHQLVWPSTNGNWPWQDSASEEYTRMHPMLCEANEFDFVQCGTHGTANVTFVCRHLLGADGIDWFSAKPDDENKWPDAWCQDCHVAFEAEGEWNEKSETAAGLELSLLCHHCYEETKARCTSHHI